jgi:ketosteroid isomerase-like protein
MKKLFMILLMAMPLAAMSQAHSGYKANYSSDFKMGDASYSEKILAVWKDFENNDLDKHTDLFADTVTMVLAEGGVVKGKANNLASAKAFRTSVKNYKVNIDAWMSLISTDRDQHWVGIWGNESYTDKDGKQVNQRVHEIWGFNKDGKISIMMQYEGM